MGWRRFAPRRWASLLTAKSKLTIQSRFTTKAQSPHTAGAPQKARVRPFVEVNRLFAVSLYLNGEHNFFVVSRLVLRWAAKRP